MEYRRSGDFSVAEVALGCYAMSGVYGPKEPASFKALIRKAYDLGVNFFDTAEAYGSAEAVLGEAVQPFRQQVYLATKVGVKEGSRPDLSAGYVRAACDESLRALKTAYIDLYQVHFDDPDTPVEDTLGALEGLVQDGKIRRYGVGHLPRPKVEIYFRAGRPFSMLMELSAVARSGRDELLPLCREHGVNAIAFSVTGRGLLTGKVGKATYFTKGDIRRIDPLFQRERFASGLRVAEYLAVLGRTYGKSAAQVAIAWVLAQPGVLCALTGPSTAAHLEENLGGSGWRLDREHLESLEAFFKQETAWLEEAQKHTVERILCDPLPADPAQAFTDLVYLIETAIERGMTSEDRVLPIFYELFGLQRSLDFEASRKMQAIQQQLRNAFWEEGREIG